MLKNEKNIGTDEIDLVTPTHGQLYTTDISLLSYSLYCEILCLHIILMG